MKRLLAAAGLLLFTAACTDPSAPLPDGAIGSEISTSVVISQVYAGGNNAGAQYNHDFIELFNKSGSAVNLGTWSVQYGIANNSTWSRTNLTGITIQPGAYVLIQEGGGTTNGVALPTPDVTASIAMAATVGKIALVSNQTTLSVACPTVADGVVDLLGYGTTANCFEGSGTTANLSNTTAAIRKGSGCKESDDNSKDFSVAAPTPRNSASPQQACAPEGAGFAAPNPVGQGGTTLLTVNVTPGTNPTSTGLTVVANLSTIMGGASQSFFDDATNGDVTPGDNVFSYETTVSASVTTGGKSIAFTVADAQARTDTSGAFTLNVVANAAPVAVDDDVDVLLNTARSLAVLANDTDGESDALTVTAITMDPTRGVAVIESDGTITYTPDNGELGADSFVYEITDTKGESDTALVTITIRAVFAEDDSYPATEEQTLNVSAPGVLTNDTTSGVCGGYVGSDWSCITSSLVTQAANGAVTLSSDGAFSYVPNSNFSGLDSFTYTAYSQGNLSNVATVVINVANVQDPPTAVADTYSVTEDVTLVRNAAMGVLANDTDPDLETLHAILDAGPSHGMLTLNDDGSFTYVPDLNNTTNDSFTYHTNDAAVSSSTVTVTLNYSAVNDAPVATDDAYDVDEDTPIDIAALTGLVANDTDVDNASLSVVVVTAPANGTFTNGAAGAFMYEPDANFHGTDTMTYRASDGAATSVATATVTFTVAAINDAPTAVVDDFTTDEDLALTVTAPGLLVNDDDVDGDAILPVLDAQAANGTVTIATDGSFVYTPAANFEGTDTFTYHVTDGTESSTIVGVTLTVDAINDAPTIPTPIGPADGESVHADDLVFTWGPSTDADGDAITYRVELLRDGAHYAQAQSSTTSATIPGELGKGDYTWRVMATDGDDNSGYSAEHPFTITKGGGGGGGGLFGCSTTATTGSPLAPAALLALAALVVRRRR